MGKVGFRILVDALAYKCGFRQVEWTKQDKVDWNRRVKENGGNRTQCILNHPSLRQEASLSESDLYFILSTDKKAEQNSAAHDMKLTTLVYTIRSLLRNPTSGQNSPRAERVVETIYERVVGETMDLTLEKGRDSRVLTPRGVEMEKCFFFEVEEIEVGSYKF